jgi:predicted metal-dependent hydrolase
MSLITGSLTTIRHPQFQFSAHIQRYWLGNNPFRTHLMNSFTLALPATEKWSIRVLRRVLKQINNPEVKQDALTFIGQEGQHASAHTLFWQNLRQQGYRIDRYLKAINVVLKWSETHLSPVCNLALLAGFEHLTECIAELCLEQHLFDTAESDLKRLFEWHAAEEIEHKTVAYDVLNDLSQSYTLRILGLVIAYIYLFIVISLGTFLLLQQDRKIFSFSVWSDLIQVCFVKEKLFPRAGAAFIEYFRSDFHPSQHDNAALCQNVLEQVE